MIKRKMKTEHLCEFFKGKIRDVSFRSSGHIYCRRCERRLEEGEINEETFKEIKGRIRR